MDEATIKNIAQQLFDAHQSRSIYAPLPENITNRPLQEAYRVQAAFNELQEAAGAGEAAGYKIALTSAAMQAFAGVDHPLAGIVYSSRVHESPAQQSLRSFIHVGVEFEVTIRLGADLPPGNAPHTRESVAAAIATCAPSYELIEDRAADMDLVNAFNLIAENNWNAGLILGKESSNWQDIDLVNGKTQLWIDGDSVGEGRTGDALGHPLEAVAWLANLLNERGEQLHSGMVVMTGSSITTRFPHPGEHYRFAVDGLGEVEIDWSE